MATYLSILYKGTTYSIGDKIEYTRSDSLVAHGTLTKITYPLVNHCYNCNDPACRQMWCRWNSKTNETWMPTCRVRHRVPKTTILDEFSTNHVGLGDLKRAYKAISKRITPLWEQQWGNDHGKHLHFHANAYNVSKTQGKEVKNKMAYTIKPYTFTGDRDEVSCSDMDTYDNLVEQGYDPVFGFEFDEDDDYVGTHKLYKSQEDFINKNPYVSCSCIDEDDINDEFEAIEGIDMFSNTLTPEQKARMNKEDQALFRLGWIDSTLQFTSKGRDAYISMIMANDYKTFAKHAQAEVESIEAENEARKNS